MKLVQNKDQIGEEIKRIEQVYDQVVGNKVRNVSWTQLILNYDEVIKEL